MRKLCLSAAFHARFSYNFWPKRQNWFPSKKWMSLHMISLKRNMTNSFLPLKCWHVFNERAIQGINHQLILQLFWPATLVYRPREKERSSTHIACECICIFNSLARAGPLVFCVSSHKHTPFGEHMQGAEWHKSSAGQAGLACWHPANNKTAQKVFDACKRLKRI